METYVKINILDDEGDGWFVVNWKKIYCKV